MSPPYSTEVERPVTVTVHPSMFPHRTRAAYLQSFRSRQMNHRFHYESEKQAQQWLAIHEAYSPSRTNDNCLRTYERAFAEIAGRINADNISLISIGCGGGQKDISLLRALKPRAGIYVPSDVSLPLALTAHCRVDSDLHLASHPLLLDLPAAGDLRAIVDEIVPASATRVFAFFGMLPNFEPEEALPPLAEGLRENDYLVVSANLAPGPHYGVGVQKILPLYDNDLTRRWLATSLNDAGLQAPWQDIVFTTESVAGLLRIEANYRFRAAQTIHIDQNKFAYDESVSFRLFFSYRHTPEILQRQLGALKLEIVQQWITASEEEGVFLCKKAI